MTQHIVRPHLQNPSAAPWVTVALIVAAGAGALALSRRASASPKKATSSKPIPEGAISLPTNAVPGQYWNVDDEADEPLIVAKKGEEYTSQTPDFPQSMQQPNYTVAPDGAVEISGFDVKTATGTTGVYAEIAFVPKRSGKATVDVTMGDVFYRLNVFVP